MKMIPDIMPMAIKEPKEHKVTVWTIAGGITIGLWGFAITTAMFWTGLIGNLFK